jgi:hypothetical protein
MRVASLALLCAVVGCTYAPPQSKPVKKASVQPTGAVSSEERQAFEQERQEFEELKREWAHDKVTGMMREQEKAKREEERREREEEEANREEEERKFENERQRLIESKGKGATDEELKKYFHAELEHIKQTIFQDLLRKRQERDDEKIEKQALMVVRWKLEYEDLGIPYGE